MKTFLALVVAGALVAAAAAYRGDAATQTSKLVSATTKVAPGTHGRVVARCPSAMHATGGGFRTTNVAANDSYPLVAGSRAAGWVLTTHKPKTPATGTATAGTATVYVLCGR